MSLDAAKLAELRQLDRDGRLMARLRDAFDQTAARQRAELLAAATAARPEQASSVQRAAHTLHAAAVQLGASELAAHCQRLERAARAGEVADLPAALQRLDSLLQDTRSELAGLSSGQG